MIRHILFWNFTEKVKEEHTQEESLRFMRSQWLREWKYRGAFAAEINRNFAGGYDLVFYAEFADEESLKKFMNHPLHVAHREKCKEIVTDRLCGDIVSE